MKILSKIILLIGLVSFIGTALAEKKNVLIIRGKSTHQKYAHNNDEVGQLIKSKIEKSKYAEQFDVKTTLNYPKDLSLVENADLIIISSDGGAKHALADKKDPTKNTKHLDGVLKKNKTGLIVIHWATDAPSGGMAQLHPENSKMMMDWIGAVYYWVNKGKDPESSWTMKFPVLEMKVNKEHPVTNGVPENFLLQDEYYFNFFTEAGGRNPGFGQGQFPPLGKCSEPPERYGEQGKLARASRLLGIYQRRRWTLCGDDFGTLLAHLGKPEFFPDFREQHLLDLEYGDPGRGDRDRDADKRRAPLIRKNRDLQDGARI